MKFKQLQALLESERAESQQLKQSNAILKSKYADIVSKSLLLNPASSAQQRTSSTRSVPAMSSNAYQAEVQNFDKLIFDAENCISEKVSE